ncbi:hypothetical protein STEG23_031579, partial [Scotinomys teguina]
MKRLMRSGSFNNFGKYVQHVKELTIKKNSPNSSEMGNIIYISISHQTPYASARSSGKRTMDSDMVLGSRSGLDITTASCGSVGLLGQNGSHNGMALRHQHDP